MMELEEIRNKLQDRRVLMVAEATGLHFNTVRNVRDNVNANPTYNVMVSLSKYLEEKYD
jgi:hypothetical protein